MEREILFRGKSIGTGEWLYGHLFNYGLTAPTNVPCICVCIPKSWKEAYGLYTVHPDSIGQYTGIKDKNGKKIFEGDILYQEQTLLGAVCISARYGISVLKESLRWALRNFVFDSDFDTGVLRDIEVHGNIFDNPELMKGGLDNDICWR